MPIRFKSLTTTLLSIFLPLVCLSVFTLFAILEGAHVGRSLDLNRETLDRVASIEAEALSQPLWDYDHDLVATMLARMRLNPDFRSARVLNSRGLVIAETATKLPSQNSSQFLDDLNTKKVIVHIVGGEQKTVGTLLLTFHAGAIEIELKERLFLDICILVVLCAVLVGITIAATRRVIGMPIGRLQRSLERLSVSNEREPVIWDSADEIGILVRTFNELQASQEAAESEIRAYQTRLESRVEERTKELADKQAQLKNILDNVQQGVVLFNEDQKLVAWNPHYPDSLNLDEQFLTPGLALYDLALILASRGNYGDTDVQELACERVRQLWLGEYRTDVSFGDDRTFDAQSTRTPDGSLVITYTDISQRKKMEEALKTREQQMRQILSDSPIAVAISVDDQTDDDGIIEFTNTRFMEMLGFLPEEIGVARTNQFFSERVGRVEHEKILDEGGVLKDIEVQVTHRNGSKLWILLSISPIQYNDRQSALIWLYDISERKKAERIIAEAMNLIHESIQYASRIQRSVLPTDNSLTEAFLDHLVIWEPKDVVGGDIYLYRKYSNAHLLMLIDCTGHGVPGAFMTMIATGALDQALIEIPAGDPAALLKRVNQLVKTVLGQDADEGESDDGLECGLCLIDDVGKTITYAGARFELWCVNSKELMVIKGDKVGLGYRRTERDYPFTNHIVPIEKGARYYMTSDGLVDQIGGDKRRAFGKRRLKEVILRHGRMNMTNQGEKILEAIDAYQGDEVRRDDIALVGFGPKV